MSVSRREFMQGAGAFSLLALFRRRGVFNGELFSIEEDDILEEYEENPSAIDLVAVPQVAFVPTRLVIPKEIAPLWTLENIVIAGESQFAGNPIPAEVFSASAIDMSLAMDAVPSQQEIRMRIRRNGPVNLKAPPERFVGCFIGRTYENRNRSMALAVSSDPYKVIF